MALFGDIVALAKAGFTPAAVKELMAMDKQQTPAEEPAEILPKEGVQPEEEKAPEEPEKEEAKPELKDNKTEELQKQIDDLKKQLKEAQKNNTKKNLSNEVPASKTNTIDEIVRSFMS